MAWHWRRCQLLVWNQFVARSTQATTPSSHASSKNKTGGTRDVWVGALAKGIRPTGFAARIGYDESFACGLTISGGLGEMGEAPARHSSFCRYRYPRRMTGRQFDRVWHHWRLSSQGFGAIARPLSVVAILSALVPVGVRSQPRWSLSRLDQIGSSPQLRDLGRDLAAFH